MANKTFPTDLTNVTPQATDRLLLADSSDGDNIKNLLISELQTFFDLTFATDTALTDHTSLTNNPHSVTLVQLGVTASAANLNSLADNSVANTLHRHSELVASDGSPDPALTVNADGLVDVGASGGGARLNVNTNLNIINGSGAAELNIIGTGDSHNFANLVFRSDEVTDKKWAIHHRQASPETNDLSFKYNNGTAWSDIVTFENGGNVGIGTTDPTSALHIIGDTTAAGNIVPEADGTRDLGVETTAQWANVWSDLINGSDFAYENNWRTMEAEKFSGYLKGIAFTSPRVNPPRGKLIDEMEGEPTFVVTEDWIEFKGRRITPEMIDKFIDFFDESL